MHGAGHAQHLILVHVSCSARLSMLMARNSLTAQLASGQALR